MRNIRPWLIVMAGLVMTMGSAAAQDRAKSPQYVWRPVPSVPQDRSHMTLTGGV